MNNNPKSPHGDAQPPESNGNGRRYWIDEDGNVHGVVLTERVDHLFEFTDDAIDLNAGPKGYDKPNS
jgi:hypothetical protein